MLQLIILEYFYDLLPLHQTMQKVFTFYLSTIFIVPKYTKPLHALQNAPTLILSACPFQSPKGIPSEECLRQKGSLLTK
jgi:hypothetical protein